MSIKLMTQVWESTVGPATKRLVLLALADSSNDEGVCWPSVATLATKAGASRRRTEEVLAELEADGVVSKQARFNNSNVYTLHLARLPDTPREIRTPREDVGDPPAKSAGPPRENTGTNRKRTQIEPKDKDCVASAPPPGDDAQPALDLPGVPVEKKPGTEDEPKLPTINQRATWLAQAHYERLGKMGKVVAFLGVIRVALERGYADDEVDRACAWIADRQWTLTEERLAHALRGGPKPAGRTAPVQSRRIVRTGPNNTGPVLDGYEG